MAQVKVLKPFIGGGVDRNVGDILEAADFIPEGLAKALAEGYVEEIKDGKK
jgi:hypothetical protein